MEQHDEQRLAVMHGWSNIFNAWHYIHKYYLEPEDKGQLFPADLQALERLQGTTEVSELLRNGDSMPGCTVYYKDLGLEKSLSGRLVAAGLLGIAAYRKERQQEMTPEELQAALQLNAWLREYEQTLHRQRNQLEQKLKKSLAGGDPFATHYEIEVELEYYLRDDDPFCTAADPHLNDWDEDISLMCRLRLEQHNSGDTDYNDHPERGRCSNPVFNEPHSWLFHDLTSHHGVPVKHLCRIGRVWGEVMVRYQNAVGVST
jgi:hypothetical protein